MTDNSLKVFSFSDAHIGHENSLLGAGTLLTDVQRARSSVSEQQRRDMRTTVEDIISECDVIVLNGDIIDKMGGLSPHNQQKTFEHVLGLVEEWAQTYPGKTFYYILGNHEAYDPYRDVQIQEHIQSTLTIENLHFSDIGVMVGDVFFTHGDLGAFGVHPSGRHYAQNSHPEHSGNENNALYELMIRHLEACHEDDLPLILVHDNAPIALDAELLANAHLVLGHTHELIDHERDNGKRIINGGHLKSGSSIDRHRNNTPNDLHQSIITLEDGIMVDYQRAFPETERWEDLVTQRRTHSGRSYNL